LRAKANLWLWSLRDFAIIGVATLLSVVALAELHSVILLAGTAGFAFLTIRFDETTVLDFIRNSARFFLSTQQFFIWEMSQ